MSTANRFQIHHTHAQQGDTVTSVGVDPLTGLPVLIYAFPGRPTVAEGVLESENIPGILSTSFDGEQGRVVTAYSRDYELLAPGEEALDADFVVEAAGALRDAAAAGVLHGDLRPGRFLHADQHVLIEGYGVPWSPRGRDFTPPEYDGEASYSGDVFSFAKALLHLGRRVLHGDMIAVLNKALLPNADMRPSAEALHTMLAAARDAGSAAAAADSEAAATSEGSTLGFDAITLTTTPVPSGSAATEEARSAGVGADAAQGRERTLEPSADFELDLGLDLGDIDPALDSPQPRPPEPRSAPPQPRPPEPRSAPPQPAPEARRAGRAGTPGGRNPAPIEIATDPDPDRMRLNRKETHDSRAGFVKELPPGATYRSGNLSESAPPAAFTFDEDPIDAKKRRRLGRLLLLGLVLVAATIAAALLLPRQESFVGPGQQTIYYTVSIGVEPPSVPRLDLITVQSPPGSSFGPGDILDTVPGQVLLDAEGVWVLQGRFQDRLTEPVELVVPAQRSATLVLPEPVDEERSLP